ncbi:MAG: hypothetical protein RI986_1398, partial [Planctomycetota bacterium]
GVNHLSTGFGTGGTGVEKVAVVATPAPKPEAPKPQEPQPAAPK